MSKARKLAKEIADEVFAYVDSYEPKVETIANIIAAKLEPLVSDAERYHRIRDWAMEGDQESEATDEH